MIQLRHEPRPRPMRPEMLQIGPYCVRLARRRAARSPATCERPGTRTPPAPAPRTPASRSPAAAAQPPARPPTPACSAQSPAQSDCRRRTRPAPADRAPSSSINPSDAPSLPSNAVLRSRVDRMLVGLPEPPQIRYDDLVPLLHQQRHHSPVVGPIPGPAVQQHDRRPFALPVVSQREPVYRSPRPGRWGGEGICTV